MKTKLLLFASGLWLLILSMALSTSSCVKGKTLEVEGKLLVPNPPNAIVNFEGHWLNEGDREKLLREMLNEYEFKNQNVKINLKFPEQLMRVTDANEIDFIINQIKKPVADWDVIRIKEHYNPIATRLNDPKWGEKYLVDFSKVPGFIESHKAFINSTSLKNRAGGIIVGPYNEGQLWAIFVNTEVAKKMGITVKQYGMTFEDFSGYLRIAHEYNKTHPYIAPIFEENSWITMEAVFKRLFYSCSNYEENLNPQLTPAKLKTIEKCYLALEELAQYEPMIRGRSKISWGQKNDYPLKDSCLFFVNGTWMYNIWKKKGEDKMFKIMPCELPVFKESDTYIGGYASNWCVPLNAPHREEAVKLLMDWCRPELAEKWVRYTKCPSGVKGNLTSTAFGIDPYESFMYTIDKKYGDKEIAQQENQYIFGSKNFKAQYRIIEVLEGKMTVDAVMSELKKNLSF